MDQVTDAAFCRRGSSSIILNKAKQCYPTTHWRKQTKHYIFPIHLHQPTYLSTSGRTDNLPGTSIQPVNLVERLNRLAQHRTPGRVTLELELAAGVAVGVAAVAVR